VELDGRLPVIGGLDPIGCDSRLVQSSERGRVLARGLAQPAQPRCQAAVRRERAVEGGARACGCGPGLIDLGRRGGGLFARRLGSRPPPLAHQRADDDCDDGDQDDQDGTVNHAQLSWVGTALGTLPLSVGENSELSGGVGARCSPPARELARRESGCAAAWLR
jgi:hypothetical protein